MARQMSEFLSAEQIVHCQRKWQQRNEVPSGLAVHQSVAVTALSSIFSLIFILGFRADAFVGELGGALLAVRVSALQPA
jgi:hypothetical protein